MFITLQEAAISVGYCGAALPLWEQFLTLLLPLKSQIQDILPTDEISRHLAQLAELYEAQSHLLAKQFAAMASLNSDSLAGKCHAELCTC